MESDLLRVWQLVHELSEQLAHNQKITAALQSQTGVLRTQAADSSAGSALRRYTTDIAKETFDSEPERTSAQLIMENQTLLHENKQLSVLLKEYENTMETVMAKFRSHALAAQQHELTLTRHYEALLLARAAHAQAAASAGGALDAATSSSPHAALALQRLVGALTAHLRALSGTPPPDAPAPSPADARSRSPSPDPADPAAPPSLDALRSLIDSAGGAASSWAAARESEIARVAGENARLRRALAVDDAAVAAHGVPLGPLDADAPQRHATLLTQRTRGGSGSGGASPARGEERWGMPPPRAQRDYQQQQQAPPSASGFLSNAGEGGEPLQPGGGGGGLRAPGPGRRPAMFGGRGAGGGGSGGRGGLWNPPPPHPPQALPAERAWALGRAAGEGERGAGAGAPGAAFDLARY